MGNPLKGSAHERAGLAAIAAQLLCEAGGAVVRARDLLELADLAGAGAVPAGLTRALADLADARIVVDSRLQAFIAALRGEDPGPAAAAADFALESLQARGEARRG